MHVSWGGLVPKPFSFFHSTLLKQRRWPWTSLFKPPSFPHQSHILYPLPFIIPSLSIVFLLLLVLLVLCSSVHLCDARSGKHWRHSRAPSTSLLRGKGKAKSSSSHKQNGKGNQSPYQQSPIVPVSPSGSPAQGRGGQGPTMPAPSSGTGYTLPPPPPPLQPPPPPSLPAAPSQDTVYNVVDFGAKGDGVTDDTQVTITAFKILCFQLGHFCHSDAGAEILWQFQCHSNGYHDC